MRNTIPYSTFVLYNYTKKFTFTQAYMDGEKHICMHIPKCLCHKLVHNQLAGKRVTYVFTNAYSPSEILFALEHVQKMSLN